MNKVVYDMVLKSIKTKYQIVKVKFMIFKVLTICPWLKMNEVGGSYKNQLGNSLMKTNLQKVNVKLNLSQSPIEVKVQFNFSQSKIYDLNNLPLVGDE